MAVLEKRKAIQIWKLVVGLINKIILSLNFLNNYENFIAYLSLMYENFNNIEDIDAFDNWIEKNGYI